MLSAVIFVCFIKLFSFKCTVMFVFQYVQLILRDIILRFFKTHLKLYNTESKLICARDTYLELNFNNWHCLFVCLFMYCLFVWYTLFNLLHII